MISIIMPLYNAERFLQETLHSIQKQTYREFELICIDDASTDNTIDILKSMQEQDERIKIYSNQERLGAAKSRNIGLSKAEGEYISFLDGDDIFEEEMLELAIKKAKKENLDVIIYEYVHVPSDNIYKKKNIYRNEKYIEKYCKIPFSIVNQSPEDFLTFTTSPWNKLYRKKFIIENKLEFQTLSSSNDVFFVLMALMLAERVLVLNDRRVMVYAREHCTPTRISFDRDPMCVYLAIERVLKELIKRDLLDVLYQHYYLRIFFLIKSGFSMSKSEEKKAKFYRFLQTEGIKNIKKLGENYYNRLSENRKYLFDGFEKKEYVSKWYEDVTLVDIRLESYSKRIMEIFLKYKRIAVWGIGKYGKSFLNYAIQNNMKISILIDNKLAGQTIGDYTVYAWEEVDVSKIDMVLVTGRGIYPEIVNQVKEKSIRIVDLCEVLEF